MPLKIGKKTKARLTKPFWGRLWGQRRKVSPIFIEKIFGDGMKLLAVTPINTRPNYYLIRVDSSWQDSNREIPCVGDHIDEICDAIEEVVGPGGYICKEESGTGRAHYEPWPALSDESGVSWCDSNDLLEKENK